MQFDYRAFHIDVSPFDEGGPYYARAKIYRRASAAVDAAEVKYPGDLGDYPSDADAIDAAQHSFGTAPHENGQAMRLRMIRRIGSVW